MKVRTDFVTNSSSSSFILVFKDKEDYEKFKNHCEKQNQKELKKCVENAIKKQESDAREKAEEFLYWVYAHPEIFRLEQEAYPDFKERLRNRKEFRNSEKVKKQIDKYLKTTEYKDQKKRLKNSEIFCETQVWDTEGDLMESSIRNGLLETEFSDWLLCELDIG